MLKREHDMSIILVSHDLDLVKEYADRVILLSNGKVEDNLGDISFAHCCKMGGE